MPSTMIELSAEYFALYRLVEAMDSVLRAGGMDFCGGNCGGSCPLCVARRRFAPERPSIGLRTTILQR